MNRAEAANEFISTLSLLLDWGLAHDVFRRPVPPHLAARGAAASYGPGPSELQSGNGLLKYRGFTLNMTPVADAPDYAAIVTAMKRQVDITAECGAKPDILTFFRNQKITVVRNTGHGGGQFGAARGVQVDSSPLPPPNNPVLLHEFLHAMHHGYVPGGEGNNDIERFYRIAQQNRLYPDATYMMSNKGEFFAITGSVYLWGVVARPPYKRETVQAKQPVYYAWLGDLFGVKK